MCIRIGERGAAIRCRPSEELAQQRATWNSEPQLSHRGGDGGLLPGQRRAGHPRFRLRQVSARWRRCARCTTTRSRPRRHIATSSSATGSISIRSARAPTACEELRRCIDKQHRLPRLRRLRARCRRPPAIPPTIPTTSCASRPAFPVLIFVGTTGLGAGLPGGGGVILDLLPSAPSRPGRRALSRAQDRRRRGPAGPGRPR